MNEDLAQQSVMNLAGLGILTAIPAVAFALWCDYFERFFQARLDAREEVDRGDELYRIRTAGFFINLFQILIFFASTPVRREHPLVAYPLFLGAILIQMLLQRGLEGKVAGGKTEEGDSFYWQGLRTFFWSLVAGLTYVASIMTSVFVFSIIAVVTNAPMPVRVGLLLCGMGVGVVAGLCLSFALGSLFVRKITQAKLTPDGELRARLQELFAKSKVILPELWLVDLPQFQFGSAMMAGFPKGKGLFKPGFFISASLVEKLSEDELRSVVLHEISHWRLEHLKKRFTFSAGLILCSSLLTGIAVLCSRFAGVSAEGQTLVGLSSLVISFIFAFRLLARQVKYQEFSADIHSIERLGSTLADLSSALRKLDRMNGAIPYERNDPGSMIVSLGHPGTEYRIRVLEKYFERRAQMSASKGSDAAQKPDQEAA
jgi:Zn-dependent protease with chaperone function